KRGSVENIVFTMPTLFRNIISFISLHKTAVAIAAVVIVGGGYLALGRGESAAATYTVNAGEFVQQISVSGKVVAAKEVDLGFSQGGRVTGVYTAVGKQAYQGTVLAEVENGDVRASLEREEAKLASLKAGTRQEELAVAEADVRGDKEALMNELKEAYAAADDAVRNQIDQFVSNPRGADPQLSFTVSDSQAAANLRAGRVDMERAFADWKAELDTLTQEGAALAAPHTQTYLAKAASLLSYAAVALNRAITNPTVSQSSIDAYSADIASARASVNAAISAVSTATSALNSSEKALALKRAGSTAETIAAQAAEVRAAQAALRKTLIVAPFDGIVTVVDAKSGKIVSPNTPEISMMSAGKFQIESFVPEVHVALVAVGDAAAVTLDAYGKESMFPAKIVSIDPAETVRDGVSTYRAVLEFDTADSRIRAGMTANVVITTDKRSGVLSVPEGAVVRREGKTYVNVQEDGETAEREVTTGALSSLGNVEVLSGLSEGEVIVLP
ncbi:efflux RND transporter periplasmic adaptor subunit, partial [Candidatus Parcubacteria bacterium]|nr:efflux RND transporter periplasmic adaptor subunit [Candidatus Parcubacteria bacterium]